MNTPSILLEKSPYLLGNKIAFHIVASDFPISQSGILGNDFFKQTSSKITYAKEHLNISGINIPFFSPAIIIIPSRSKSLFYVRIRNPEIKIGYIPKLKIAHGIYLGDIRGDSRERLWKDIFEHHEHIKRN